jgi:hypothetical protein
VRSRITLDYEPLLATCAVVPVLFVETCRICPEEHIFDELIYAIVGVVIGTLNRCVTKVGELTHVARSAMRANNSHPDS